ncbi:inositol 5-phosphatase [Teratosphaeria nubilosa]|uniref:Inositol 5-phosphatase n=1 Tax=Teratosphaeria nubilosa TaxID=161662 RepID=A0A6G1KV79_9PEZI|nr:inositol 5-phosphatase [Teratosphaeria nubilosa]
MADLNIYLTTFNAARSPINIDYFAANLFNSLNTDLPPALIVLSLQELAPIAYGFLGGSWLAPYFANFAEAVRRAATGRFGKDGSRYVSVIARNVGLTGIVVFARPEVESRIRWIESGGVGCGLWEMGNKGGVGVRLGLSNGGDEAAYTFVAAHLAPTEERWERRNADWKSICQGLVFERITKATGTAPPHNITHGDNEQEPLLSPDTPPDHNEHSIFTPPTYLFFAGDLNYRTSDTKPSPSAHSQDSWPQPVDPPSDPRHITHHLPRDQLSRELSKGNTLHLLTEAPITFAPTYKYSNAAQANEVWLWAKHRVPSWCDRVLYLQTIAPSIQIRAYAALPIQPTSDHRPVVLSCAVPKKAIEETVKPPFPIRKDWKQRRATARRLEIVVGLGAYLTLTWEGRILSAVTVVGIVGGYFALIALLGW